MNDFREAKVAVSSASKGGSGTLPDWWKRPSTIYTVFSNRFCERAGSRRGWPLLRVSWTFAVARKPPLQLVI